MIADQMQYTWRIAAITVCSLLILTLGVYHETVGYLVGLWFQFATGNYAHGFLVLGISAYLVVSNRHELSRLAPCIDNRAIAAVFTACMVWLIAAVADVQSLQTVGLLLAVLAIVWAFTGRQATGKLLFPILFIGFAIPVWFPLSPILQDITAAVVFRIVRILEIPAMLQDNVIVLPAGKLSVEEACGGLNYLLAALTLSSLYAYLHYRTLAARLTVVIVAAAAAVVSNMIRVFTVVYLGYTTRMQHPMINDHLSLGWYIFGAMVLMLMVLDYRLHAVRTHDSHNGESAVSTTQPPYRSGRLRYTGMVAVCALLIVSGPALVYSINNTSGSNSANIPLELPAGIAGWEGPLNAADDWKPVYYGSVSNRSVYQRNSDRVYVYMARYVEQKQGEELINGMNSISNVDVWLPKYPRAITVESGDYRMLEQVLERDTRSQRLVWYWYRMAGVHTTNDYQAKVLQVLGILTGNRPAMVVAVATELDDSDDRAQSVLGEFVQLWGRRWSRQARPGYGNSRGGTGSESQRRFFSREAQAGPNQRISRFSCRHACVYGSITMYMVYRLFNKSANRMAAIFAVSIHRELRQGEKRVIK